MVRILLLLLLISLAVAPILCFSICIQMNRTLKHISNYIDLLKLSKNNDNSINKDSITLEDI